MTAVRHFMVPVLLPALILACSDAAQPPSPQGSLFNASGGVVESEMRAVLDGRSLSVEVPIVRRSAGPMTGAFTVRLVDIRTLDEIEVDRTTVQLAQSEARRVHRWTLAGLPDGIEPADLAGYAIDWTASLTAGPLSGRKSAWAALQRLEIQVLGATEMPQGGNGVIRVLARDVPSGDPISDAVVQIARLGDEPSDRALLAEGTTDARGEAGVEFALAHGGRVQISVSKDGVSAQTETHVSVVGQTRIALSSDKTIYKPGQQVHLRALALHGIDKTPVSDAALVFEATDGKGNKVFKRTVSTNHYGVAHVAVPTDVRVNEGRWKFRAVMNDTQTEIARPIERYNLPKLKVEVTADAEFVQPGNSVAGWVSARYAFGEPVLDASILIKATLSDGRTLVQQNGQLDQEGRHRFEFALPEGLSSSKIADGEEVISVSVEVTDAAGQSELGSLALPLVEQPLILRLVSESGNLIPQLDNRVWVLVTDVTGRPVVAQIQVSGGVEAQGTTGADGVFAFEVDPVDADAVQLVLSAVDGADRRAQRELALGVATSDQLLVRTDRSVVEEGEEATISVFGPNSIDQAWVDLFRGAEVLQSVRLDMNDGFGQASIATDASSSGVLRVEAFALGSPGMGLRGSTKLWVRSEDTLDVQVSSTEGRYQPGDNAVLSVQVRAPDGQPAVAAVGLTAVDEAVFPLGGEPDQDLRSFFNLRPGTFGTNSAGLKPSDLFEATGPSLETMAQLLFAASTGQASPGLDYNSERRHAPKVRSTITDRVWLDVVAFVQDLAGDPRRHQLEPESMGWVLQRAKGMRDAFGAPYLVTSDPNTHWSWLKVTSAGPDETFSTEDDVEVGFNIDVIRWADPSGIQRGWLDGSAWMRDGGAGGAFDDVDLGAAVPTAEAAEPAAPPSNASEPGRVRADFRETILVEPSLITDESGRASLQVPLADSITTWRVTAEANSVDGKLGSALHRFQTFQRFFVDFEVPTHLTMGDEVTLSAVVYNYMDTPQTVAVVLDDAPWMTVLGQSTAQVQLEPSAVRSVSFRIRADEAGEQSLALRGLAGEVSDALVRTARVAPNGVRNEVASSEQLEAGQSVTLPITIPAGVVKGGTEAVLTLTPGFGAEAVSGMEGLVKEPGGCFEQTTSTAWPNTMVARYLDTTGQMTPELREELIGVVTRGYQRLLTFESPTGGFNWWGDNDPGNRILSAIMLWHLKDLQYLIEVDDAVRQRTLTWLLSQQRADGSWPSGDALHSGNEVLGTSDARTTAFIVWALAHTEWAPEAVQQGAAWLSGHLPDQSDLYANALAINALAFSGVSGTAINTVFGRLDDAKLLDDEARIYWPTEAPSWTGASGNTAAIETTSLVAYGLMAAETAASDVQGAMRFLIANKDAVGSWYNTQATMNALRALLGAASPRGSEAEGTLFIEVNGQAQAPIAIERDQGDVVQQFDLLEALQAGDNSVQLRFVGEGKLSFQVRRVVHELEVQRDQDPSMRLEVNLLGAETSVGSAVQVQTRATFLGEAGQRRDQVMVRVGLAPGLVPNQAQLDAIVAQGLASRVEVAEGLVSFYLMDMQSGQTRALDFEAVANLPIDAQTAPSEMYVYYEPQIRTELAGQALTVR